MFQRCFSELLIQQSPTPKEQWNLQNLLQTDTFAEMLWASVHNTPSLTCFAFPQNLARAQRAQPKQTLNTRSARSAKIKPNARSARSSTNSSPKTLQLSCCIFYLTLAPNQLSCCIFDYLSTNPHGALGALGLKPISPLPTNRQYRFFAYIWLFVNNPQQALDALDALDALGALDALVQLQI